MRLRIEALEEENCKFRSLLYSKQEQFKASEVYHRFNQGKEWNVTSTDWSEFCFAVESAYPGFSLRLQEQWLKLSDLEWKICYLIKAEVSPSRIAQLLNCTITNISMTRKRLYEKIHGKEGSASSFDQFIRDL